MPTKSIIDISVDDSEFNRFRDAFRAYQTDLAKTPGLWAKAGKEQEESAQAAERMAASLMAIATLRRSGADDAEKQNKTLTLSERLWTSMSRSTKDVAKNVVGATTALLRWTGLLSAVSGLLGAGGLWGIDRMAASAGGERRSSSGLGLSIGQQKAFGQSLGRLVDPGSFLGWVNSMELDISKQGAAYALQGGRGLSGNTSNDALSLLDAIRAKGQTLPLSQLQTVLGGYGLSMSDEDLRRLVTSSNSEYGQLRSSYQRDSLTENISDKTAKQWQDFTEQMQRAKEQIFKVFVQGLVPLEGPLQHLSAAFVNLVEVSLRKGGAVEGAINSVADWLEHFNAKVTSAKFEAAITSFTSDVGILADFFHKVAHPGETAEAAAAGYGKWALKQDTMGLIDLNAMAQRTDFLNDPSKGAYLTRLAEADKAFKLPAGTLERQWIAESGGSLNPADSSQGAIGAFQFLPSTAKELGIDPRDPLQSMYAAGGYDAARLREFNGDLAEALAAYNWGSGNVSQAVGKYGKDWFQHAPAETQNYVMKQGGRVNGVDIVISNQTGGSAIVTASGLAH